MPFPISDGVETLIESVDGSSHGTIGVLKIADTPHLYGHYASVHGPEVDPGPTSDTLTQAYRSDCVVNVPISARLTPTSSTTPGIRNCVVSGICVPKQSAARPPKAVVSIWLTAVAHLGSEALGQSKWEKRSDGRALELNAE